MSGKRPLAERLHLIAERVACLDLERSRLQDRLGETRGTSLERSYAEGEHDAYCHVLEMLDHETGLGEVERQLTAYVEEYLGNKA